MASTKKYTIPVLLGPTAVGKTSIALHLASLLDLEIISCDSRQVYRFMNIGTAKPSADELSATPHHLVNIIEPSSTYSAFQFVQDCTAAIESILSRGKLPLLCGGTGLYFRALRDGFGAMVESDPLLRSELMVRGLRDGSVTLHEELCREDPAAAQRIHSNDLQRIVRALAVKYQTGNRFSDYRNGCEVSSPYDYLTIVLTLPRDILYERINGRVESMIRMGLLKEFTLLRERAYDRNSPGMQCLGYKELFDFEEGRSTLPQAIELIQRNTRRYAKRQMTWFRNQLDGIELDGLEGISRAVELLRELPRTIAD